MTIMQDEIRINARYAHRYSSDYDYDESVEDELQADSTPIVKKHSILTRDYLQKMMQKTAGMTSLILPPNCRYLEKVNDGTIVVVEEPPAFRTISLRRDLKDEVKKLEEKGLLEEYGYDEYFNEDNVVKRFTLALPYCVFFLYINNDFKLGAGQIYFRVARIAGMADYLMKAPFPNISDAQYICFGDQAHMGFPKSLNAAVDQAITSFWSAEFNSDYTYNIKAYENIAGVNSFMEWHALSQRDPMFIYNVGWVKIPMTIGDAVDEIKRNYKLTALHDIRYKTLSDMFVIPGDTGRDEPLSKRSRRKHRLYYDVAEGMFIDSQYYVHVGDPFYIKNGKELCYINSLIGFTTDGSGDIKYIRVEREDGKLILFKNTKKFEKFLMQKTKELRFVEKATMKNGIEVKENDIVVVKTKLGSKSYKKVSFIRKTQEGVHEGRFGDSFYIVENLDGEIFDVEKPVYDGVQLNKNEAYLITTSPRNELPLVDASVMTYKGIDVSRFGRLVFSFEHTDEHVRSGDFTIPIDGPSSDRYKIMKVDNCKPLPGVFRIGRKLMAVREKPSGLQYEIAYGTPYGVTYDPNYRGMRRPSPGQIRDDIMKEDSIFIPSFDLDIEFKIGDKVVVSDWVNPTNMLSVKTIQGFTIHELSGDVDIIMQDKQENIHTVRYIESSGVVNIGKVRKITNEYEGLRAGTKIKARETGIAHFPKKDVNIIVGFLTDTGGPEPLVLCSNCCTLWYSDVMEKFSKTTMKSKKWASLKHAPIDISKIKYQPGDIIQGTDDHVNDYGWFVFKVHGFRGNKAMQLSNYTQHVDYFTLDKYLEVNTRLDYIPTPRVTGKAQSESETISAWPNFHGYYFTCDTSPYRFMQDERSIINVQCSPE